MVIRQQPRSSLARTNKVKRLQRVSLLVIAVLLSTLAPQATTAGTGWCRTDPVVAIGGQLADVFVSAPLDAPLLVTGPNHIVITLPLGVDRMLIASTLGFGQGEIVEFAESPSLRATADRIDVRIKVYVPATDDAMPVLVEFAPELVGSLAPASAEGTANTWISLRTWI